MKWFFAVSEVSMDHHDHDFRALIRSAVNSARANTQLKPHMIFDGEEGTFTKEIRDLGVKIIRHRISFYDQIQHAQKAHRPDWASYMFVASGALLRLEIPLLEQHDDFVLYTDCDVLFLKQPDFTTVRPPLFAVAPERDLQLLRRYEFWSDDHEPSSPPSGSSSPDKFLLRYLCKG